MWRICGFRDPLPQEKVFTGEDVEMLRVFDTSRRLFGEELTTQLARVLGSAMARVADAAISTFATNVRSQSQTKPLTLEEVRAANQTAAAMLPAAVRVMDVLLRHHMESRSRGPISLAGEFEGVDVLQRTVGFCDLVGYTSLAETLSATEISAVLNVFEGTVSDVIAAGGGNVVKLIGDEVMFITHEGSTACDIALNLADAFGRDGGLPPVRCGLASGQVILREGDYHGAVVNLAARIVKVASPGDVLAPASFVETIDTSHAFENVGPLDLAGFERPVEIVVVRRA
jgi:adenylate cyclase